MAEAAWLAVWIFLGQTLGRIPFLGILVMALVGILAVGSCVALSLIGLVRVLARERSPLPLVGAWIDRWWP